MSLRTMKLRSFRTNMLLTSKLKPIRKVLPRIPVHKVIGTAKHAEAVTIKRALVDCNGNRRNAACLLGIGTRTLYRKIKEYGIG